MRIDRMLAIVVLLLNRKSITARDLAERFEVSVRSVYRDIDAINQAGIPVISSQGRGGGFSILENYRLNHQFLSLENTRAIITALKGVNTTLQDRDVELTLEKIRSLVPVEKAEELERQLDQFVVDYQPWGTSRQMQKRIQEIHRAIGESRLVTIHYQNLKGEESIREVEPMTLMFKGFNWYLFGYCLQKKDGRLFRLSRIKVLEHTTRTFNRRTISFRDFTQEQEPKQPLVNIELKFDPLVNMRVQEFFLSEQISRDEQGMTIVKAAFPEDHWVYALILSYGEYVEVLKPKRLRQLIATKAKKIQEKNQT